MNFLYKYAHNNLLMFGIIRILHRAIIILFTSCAHLHREQQRYYYPLDDAVEEWVVRRRVVALFTRRCFVKLFVSSPKKPDKNVLHPIAKTEETLVVFNNTLHVNIE